MTGPRASEIATFLENAGWASAQRISLAGDASPRRYHRLRRDGGGAVLMDAPFTRATAPLAPPYITPEPEPFLALSRHLVACGFSAPRVLAADSEAGLILLEDLGDDLFAALLRGGPPEGLEAELYTAAVDALVALARAPLPEPSVPPYDLATYLFEAQLSTTWYMPAFASMSPDAAKAAGVALAQVLTPCLEPLCAERCLALRDVHAENLLWLPERSGIAQVGLLDFQDALLGHPAYDLTSLLRDARRDVPLALLETLLERYIAGTGAEPGPLRTAFAVLGVQRQLKILGIFARLCLRDGKPIYLEHLPRVWAHLQRDLEHPALADVAGWVAATLPAPEPERIATLAAEAA